MISITIGLSVAPVLSVVPVSPAQGAARSKPPAVLQKVHSHYFYENKSPKKIVNEQLYNILRNDLRKLFPTEFELLPCLSRVSLFRLPQRPPLVTRRPPRAVGLEFRISACGILKKDLQDLIFEAASAAAVCDADTGGVSS
ncbi:hypothetical protein EVAR_92940_1 [Eumeta japonica]|uniref:Uncharacterized protein n=1 Tax=Eumeta variegata TaxID=151549 RepID=A0A4C1TDA9_EUMVA|nr:hypothetical protein EVAR_92940_1 [Eumeta japonica]